MPRPARRRAGARSSRRRRRTRARRAQPRLVAAGAALGAGRRGARPRRGRGRPAIDRRRSPPSSRVCAAHARAADRAGGRSGVCGASVPVFGGVVLDITGLAGIVDVDAVSGVVEVLAGTFGPDLEPSSRSATGSASATSRRASTSPPSAAGSPAAAPASTRPATARSRTSSSASRSCSPTARSCAPAARRPPPSDPTSPSCSSGPRARSASSPGCGCGPIPCPPTERRAAYRFPSFADGIEACRRMLRRGATPAVLRLYDGVESAREPRRRRHALHAARPRRGRPGDRRRDDGRRRRRVRRRPARGTAAVALVDDWLDHRNDTSALQALTRKGFVVDTMEIAAPWSRLPGLFDDVRRRTAGGAHARRRQLPPVPQLPRRRLPVLHVRRHAAAGGGRGDVRRPVGRRPAGRARPRRQPVPPPRRRAQPGPVRRRGARAGVRRAARASRTRSTPAASSTPASSGCRRRSARRRGRHRSS